MKLFGIQINFGGSTTLDEIEEADSQYNELRANADHDGAEDLAEEMHSKGFLPHWDRDNQTWYFVDPHAE